MRYSNIEKCLFGYVGLADKFKCECLNAEEKLQATFNGGDIFGSSTGYYISDLVEANEAVYAIKDCHEDSIWNYMQDAKTSATKDMITDLRMSIMQEYDNRYENWVGTIGEKKEHNIIKTDEWSSILICPDEINGAGVWITDFCFGLADGSGRTDITVQIYRTDDMTSPIFSGSYFEAAGGTWSKTCLENPIYLPFDQSSDCDNYSYIIMWDSIGANVFRNRVDCGCSGKVKYKKYFNAFGSTFNAGCDVKTNGYTFGLSVGLRFVCDPLEYVCKLDEIGDYGMKDVLGKTLQYKSASNLVTKILDSDNISYYTLLNRENLYGKRNHFEKKYREYIDYIIESLEHKRYTQCLKCKQKNRTLFKKSILI